MPPPSPNGRPVALRRAIPVIAALVIAATATVTTGRAPREAAYAPRVVIVVGPSGGATRDYLGKARAYAAQAQAYGARSPSVLHAPRHLGPRPRRRAGRERLHLPRPRQRLAQPVRALPGPHQERPGPEPVGRLGQLPGEVLRRGPTARAHPPRAGRRRPAQPAVLRVGRRRAGHPRSPSWTVAVRRVDNFAAGFLAAGATAVLADGHTSLVYEIPALFAGRQGDREAVDRRPGRERPRPVVPVQADPGRTSSAWTPTRRRPGSTGRSSRSTARRTPLIRIAALLGHDAREDHPAGRPRRGRRVARLRGQGRDGRTSRAALAVDRGGPHLGARR